MVGIGGTSLLFIVAHEALTQSSYFKARRIVVEGNDRLSTEDILKQAEVKPGVNILGVNLRILRFRLLANPWIVDAEVGRQLPDTIHIRVTERAPIGKVELDRFYYLDHSGELVKTVEPSDQIRVPVVTGLKVSDIDLNSQARSQMFKPVMEALHLGQLCGGVLPLHALCRIHADPDMGITLFGFESGLTIKLGFGDYESKFSRLRDIVSYLGRGEELSNIECVDLNDVDRVVVRPSKGGSALRVCYRKEV